MPIANKMIPEIVRYATMAQKSTPNISKITGMDAAIIIKVILTIKNTIEKQNPIIPSIMEFPEIFTGLDIDFLHRSISSE